MEVSLERAGKFNASKTMIANSHKCAAMATTEYHYNVKIIASDERLTPEGFVLNNELVQSYFDNRFGELAKPWDAVSCELIAIISCKEITDKVKSDGVNVLCVECTILGSNGAKITARLPQPGYKGGN